MAIVLPRVSLLGYRRTLLAIPAEARAGVLDAKYALLNAYRAVLVRRRAHGEALQVRRTLAEQTSTQKDCTVVMIGCMSSKAQ
jgi:hypothetical protein